jgi:hypothetical protein
LRSLFPQQLHVSLLPYLFAFLIFLIAGETENCRSIPTGLRRQSKDEADIFRPLLDPT